MYKINRLSVKLIHTYHIVILLWTIKTQTHCLKVKICMLNIVPHYIYVPQLQVPYYTCLDYKCITTSASITTILITSASITY
jgi:hypothetical protein